MSDLSVHDRDVDEAGSDESGAPGSQGAAIEASEMPQATDAPETVETIDPSDVPDVPDVPDPPETLMAGLEAPSEDEPAAPPIDDDILAAEWEGMTAVPETAGATPDVRDEPVAAPLSPEPEPAVAALAPRPRARRRVSAEIARQLHAMGARFCFTVPGELFLPLLDDLASAGVRVVTTHHESSAAFMAEALAQATGRPQLVAVTRAVGAANAAIGIHAASQDSAPLVAVVGQVERRNLGREAFQEADIVRSIGSLAAWAVQVDDPSQTQAILAKAWKPLTSGRPGPIVLSLPGDILDVELDLDEATPSHPGARGPAADREVVSRVVKMLAASERGVIVAGGGVARARATKRLVSISEALAVPVMAAWRRPDVFPNDHANYLGMTGVWSAPTVRERLADADVIVYLGARMSEPNTFDYAIPAAGTRWAHIDLQPRTAHAGLAAPTIAVESDASRFLDAAWSDLRAAALDNEMRSRREARLAADREAYRHASRVGEGRWDGPGVHPGRIVEALRQILPDNATIATDAGNMGGWLARGYRFRRPGTFLGTTSGAMGFGVPAAIAASLNDPDRIAIAVCGDGGFAMSMMEIETAVREGAHPIIIVFDNQAFGTTALEQARQGRSTKTSELGPTDLAAVARAQGALGFTVVDDDGFEPALREAIAARRISLIHLALDRAWRSVDDVPVTVGS